MREALHLVLAEIRPKIRLLAVGFNGQIRKGTPFSLDSAPTHFTWLRFEAGLKKPYRFSLSLVLGRRW